MLFYLGLGAWVNGTKAGVVSQLESNDNLSFCRPEQV